MWKRLKNCFLAFVVLLTGAVAVLGAACNYEEQTEYETYVKYTDVAYGDSARQKVDISIPKEKTGEVGLLLAIHGGGWMAGDKESLTGEHTLWCGERGYVTAALNYRYASANIHIEDILNDITMCLTVVKKMAKEHGLDVEKALLYGLSAGAHLAMQYAYTKADVAPVKPVAVCSLSGPTEFLDENYWTDNPLRDNVIEMFSNVCGIKFDMTNFDDAKPFLKQTSPINYVRATSAPTIICQGANDGVVPKTNGELLAAKLAEYGVRHDLIIYPNSGHGLESDPDCAALADEKMWEYAREYLS